MKIAILRALQLGDLLCTVPAFRALRLLYPQAEITLLGLPWQRDFAQRYSKYLDKYIWFPGWPGLPEQPLNPGQSINFLIEMQQNQFDLILQMQGSGTHANDIVALCGARRIEGFNITFPYPNQGHEINRMLSLINHLGSRETSVQLEFPITQSDIKEFHQLSLNPKPHSYICIHPGARDPKRRWSPQNFARIADYCHQAGFQIILTGSKSEASIINEVVSHMQAAAVNLSGKTTLGSLAVLLSQSQGVISNDTGVAHLAVALNLPSIVISLSSEPERWNPLDTVLHPSVDGKKHPSLDAALHLTSLTLFS